jgi:hypothetical protein
VADPPNASEKHGTDHSKNRKRKHGMRLCFSEAPIAVNEIHLNNRSWSRFSGEGDAFVLEAAASRKRWRIFGNGMVLPRGKIAIVFAPFSK